MGSTPSPGTNDPVVQWQITGLSTRRPEFNSPQGHQLVTGCRLTLGSADKQQHITYRWGGVGHHVNHDTKSFALEDSKVREILLSVGDWYIFLALHRVE